jgi:RNA polymerase sigma-70 factor, ECF subfamily
MNVRAPLPAATIATVGGAAMASPPTTPTGTAVTGLASAAADEDSRAWLRRLRARGAERERALADLHELLLRAARFEVARRRARMPELRGDDHDDLAHQSADDALVAILAKLDDYRGESRFTTWAYKFALYEAAAALRRRAWQGREVPLAPESWTLISSRGPTPDEGAATSELLAAIGDAIEHELTPHQREILVAIALNGVPIDVLAERLATSRGALYKTLHDARRKLRARIAERGFRIDSPPESEGQ